jgi:hypothetical protein
LISSTQRQLSSWVMILRTGRERGGDDRQRARRHQRAAKTLRRARGDQGSAIGCQATGQRREREHEQRQDEYAALPEVIGRSAAEHQEARERDRVGVDDPLQFGRQEAEARLDRGQRDVDDAQVEDHHELRHAADDQQPHRTATLLGLVRRRPGYARSCCRVNAHETPNNCDWSRPMRKTPRNAMLTTLAILASSGAVAGCGGKGTSSSSATQTTSSPTTTTTTTTHKHNTKPGY